MAYRATEKTQAKKAGTRQRILEECYKLVSQAGFRGVSVNAVAQRADIATGSIYRHFPSKADMVAEIFRFCTQHELQAVADAAGRTESPIENLHAAVNQFSQRAIKGRRLAYALIAEPVDPAVEKERLAYRYAYTEIFEDVIAEGVQTGDFVAQNPAITASAIVGLLGEVLLEPLGRENTGVTNRKKHLADTDYLASVTQLIDRMVGISPPSSASPQQPLSTTRSLPVSERNK